MSRVFLFEFSNVLNSLLKYKKFFRLGTKRFHFLEHKKLFKSGLLLLFELGRLLPEYKSDISQESFNLREYKKMHYVAIFAIYFV